MKTTSRYHCHHPDCPEFGFYEHDSRKEQREHSLRMAKRGGWKCTRHTYPNEVLMPNDPGRTIELKQEGGFWKGEGHNNGFAHGPCWKAWATDFPEGTVLRLHVVPILPAATTQHEVQPTKQKEK